ncbi:MAG: tRNA (adenosine(37)-N6)-threonylcarbamoyltransferase complex transferase subunit TsaD [Candidatus Magasanikbacteria bacterium RIFCSPLOWO2_02_FULL_44_11]|uniref:tRNA N6-adenosine threonylcarbamoyltransferase n=2 Tax=Candidatus Magasanikiibacteriota TaxID=1752731 RepID=A0A1F6N9D3_9BACT|nr:MAG: tRNA (adenosine(37)-N6)-threonylcarbamoyltransferase complex transferase subunit TsaD [Candidatus Magasanikbacteria bacterium RIFCSPHIGHO2_02_FULL_45_10]OGH80378.1 MAG: tRNA (adenosine(37)-N6)-threonylcarbamoyltransferase complex transferase subunit TsaD [Candidatus Magasanikbacteria bacterium RIFCSPLOWO2_02_FULL_44_11]
MYILGIESSCDDTSVALLDSSDEGQFVIKEKTASQIDIHKKYGGVVPEIAGRRHAEKIVPLIEEVLDGQPTPDAIAVTAGPGLITGLLVGVTAAKTLSLAKNIPLVPVNHIKGHIHSVEIAADTTTPRELISFPALCLVVSGGHTELILMKSNTDHIILGLTKDDAAGECFDKVAKLVGFDYPGGPSISKMGTTGRADAISFPRPMLKEPNLHFSFAGLKTSALYWLRDNKFTKNITKEDFCASFEQAIVDVLVAKTLKAAGTSQPKSLVLAGGVSANKKLRNSLENKVKEQFPTTNFLMALPQYCMDNGAMIAAAGYYAARDKKFIPWDKFNVNPNWKVGPIVQ